MADARTRTQSNASPLRTQVAYLPTIGEKG